MITMVHHAAPVKSIEAQAELTSTNTNPRIPSQPPSGQQEPTEGHGPFSKEKDRKGHKNPQDIIRCHKME